MNLRTTPDQQLPANNGLSNRDLWHWCLVWKWEQQSYDVPLLSKLTTRQKKDLKTIEQRLTEFLDVKKAPQGQIDAAYKTLKELPLLPPQPGPLYRNSCCSTGRARQEERRDVME